jgi:glycoside/pentoside/hexuronide:cation symporter, GPH family
MSEAQSSPAGPPPLGVRTRILFGVGSLAIGAKNVAYSAYLLIFYNQVMGLNAALVSLALTISLFVDAFTNPVLGQISDNLRSRWGRRHPFMYASALPTALFFYLMFNPPAGLSDGAMFWYIFVVATLGRIAINFYELPSSALTPELSENYDERTRLMTWRYFFGYVGGLGTAFLALTVFLQPTPEHPVGQLNPDGYAAYGLAGAILIFVSILVSTLGTHDRIKYIRQAEVRPARPVLAQMREVFETLGNRNFLAIFAFGVLKYTAIGLYGAIAVYLGVYVWELSPNGQALLTIDGAFAALIALIVAPRLSLMFGKRNVAIAAAVFGVLVGSAPLLLRQLGLFLPNEPETTLVLVLFAIAIVYNTNTATSSIMTSAMVADCVEESATRTGRHSAGVFFAASAFMQTCTAAFGVMGAGLLLAAANFPENAKPGQVPAETIDRLIMIYLPVSAGLWLIGVLILSLHRGDRSTHEANVARLRGGLAD